MRLCESSANATRSRWTRSVSTHICLKTTSVLTASSHAVVDAAPSRKKSRGGLNVFQYAGTVEEAAWNDEQQKKALEVRERTDLVHMCHSLLLLLAWGSQRRLAGLRDTSQKKRQDTTAPGDAAPGLPPQPPGDSSAKPPPPPSPSTNRTKHQASNRTYTIVQQEREEDPYARRRHATAP